MNFELIFLVVLFLLSLTLNIFLLFYSFKKAVTSKPKPITEEFTDILDDMKVHGYSVVRINPDHLFYRNT